MSSEPSSQTAKASEVNALGQALLTMAHELWVVKDRQIVLEAALRESGLECDLDDYKPDASISARIAEERSRFVATIVEALMHSGVAPTLSRDS